MNNTELKFKELLAVEAFGADMAQEVYAREEIQEIVALSKKHFCQVIVGERLKARGVKLSEKFDKSLTAIIYRNYKNLSIQNEVINRLRENNIECIVLKGSSVSMNYPEPLHRILGDIDILVPEKDYDRAVDLFLDGEERSKIKEKHKFHYEIGYKGFDVEIHRHITEYEKEDKALTELMEKAFDDICVGKADIFEFPVLNNKLQAVSLLIHLKRHMSEGENNINMRLLLDWLVFANKISAEEWNKEIYPVLKTVKINKSADAFFRLSDKYFCTDNRDKYGEPVSEEFVDLLMESFMSAGKNQSLDSSITNNISVLYANAKGKNKLTKWIWVLNEISCEQFACAKYKILLPFCWIVICVRYAVRLATGKRPSISYSRIMKKSDSTSRIFDELNQRK